MKDYTNIRQIVPYLAKMMDSNPEVAAEAERIGFTQEDLQMVDHYLERLEESADEVL